MRTEAVQQSLVGIGHLQDIPFFGFIFVATQVGRTGTLSSTDVMHNDGCANCKSRVHDAFDQ